MFQKKYVQPITLLIVLIAALMFASVYIPAPASAQTTTYPWPMFHYDSSHTGYTPSPAPATFQLGWKYLTASVFLLLLL